MECWCEFALSDSARDSAIPTTRPADGCHASDGRVSGCGTVPTSAAVRHFGRQRHGVGGSPEAWRRAVVVRAGLGSRRGVRGIKHYLRRLNSFALGAPRRGLAQDRPPATPGAGACRHPSIIPQQKHRARVAFEEGQRARRAERKKSKNQRFSPALAAISLFRRRCSQRASLRRSRRREVTARAARDGRGPGARASVAGMGRHSL